MLGTRLPAAGIDEGLLSPGSRPAVLSLAPETYTSLHCDGHATDGAAAWPDPAKTDITYRAGTEALLLTSPQGLNYCSRKAPGIDPGSSRFTDLGAAD